MPELLRLPAPFCPEIKPSLELKSVSERERYAQQCVQALQVYIYILKHVEEVALQGQKIAIDGYGGIGKDTLGDGLQEWFQIPKLTASFFYRAVTEYFLSNPTFQASPESFQTALQTIRSASISMVSTTELMLTFYGDAQAGDTGIYHVSTVDLERDREKIEAVISQVAGTRFVTDSIDPLIVALLSELDSWVTIGRDNSVRLEQLREQHPEIMLLYLYGSYEVIAERAVNRFVEEAAARAESVSQEKQDQVAKTVITRTKADHTRKVGRLLTVEEALQSWYTLILDSSHLTPTEVLVIVMAVNFLIISDYDPLAVGFFREVEDSYLVGKALPHQEIAPAVLYTLANPTTTGLLLTN